MNRVTSTERKTPQLRGALRESVSLLGRQTESAVKVLSPLIPSKVNSKLRVRSNYPIPSSGKPTAERICVDHSLALDSKKRWLALKKGTTPVQCSVEVCREGRAPSIHGMFGEFTSNLRNIRARLIVHREERWEVLP